MVLASVGIIAAAADNLLASVCRHISGSVDFLICSTTAALAWL